jgi:Domain of unknown function (DUF4868)
MKPTEALEALAALIAEGPALQVAVVARGPKKADAPDVRRLSLAGAAEDHFRGVISTAVVAKLGPPPAWQLKAFDPVYKPDPEDLEWVSTDAVGAVIQAAGRLDDLAARGVFDGADDGYIRRLLYWGAALGPAENRAYFFRRMGASSELRRKPGRALLLRNGTFDLVEERIFLFDEAIDCFVYGGFVFVLRKRDYRAIFDLMQELFKRATAAAGELHKRIPISNFADFEAACGHDSRLADKLLAVRGRSYFPSLSYEMVKPVIDKFELQIPTSVGTGGSVELEFESEPAGRFRILKLIDDDFLRSSMTDLLYEVNSKQGHAEQ